MYKFLKYISGYLFIHVSGVSPERFMNLCGARKILLWNIQKTDDGYQMYISRKAFYQIKDIVYKTSSRVVILKRIGLPFLVPKIMKKWFFLCMILFSILIGIASQFFLWDIEIEGENEIKEEDILVFLEDEGIHIGVLKHNIDIESLEREMREKYSQITWVTVYMKQNKLYVNINENDKTLPDKTDQKSNYNICATQEGKVMSIITRTGTPQVSIGDSVKKGDILVEGSVLILDQNEMPSYEEQVIADADIMIQTCLHKSIKIPLYQNTTLKTGKVKSYPYLMINDKVFRFKILNIPFEEYETEPIQKNKSISIFGTVFCAGIQNVYETKTEKNEKTEEEIKKELKDSLSEYLISLQEKGIQIISKNVNIKRNIDNATLDTRIMVNGPFYQNVIRDVSQEKMELLEADSE